MALIFATAWHCNVPSTHEVLTLRYFRPLYPFLLGWVLMLSTATFSQLGLINGLAQLLLFAGVVCLPIWRTGRMCYVDIGWPCNPQREACAARRIA